MRRLPALVLAAAAAAAGAPACSTAGPQGSGEFMADVAEFFGGSDPVLHAGRLDRLHETAGFRHVPDVPPTYEACLSEIGILAGCDYGTWREAAIAAFVLTRVAVEDSAGLHRGAAVRALARLGGMFVGAEDPPRVPGTEGEVARALEGLRAIHGREDGLHPTEEGAALCAGLVDRIGDLRFPLTRTGTAAEMRLDLKTLRGALLAVAAETRSGPAHADPAVAASVDRTLANLGAQAVRHALAVAVLRDRDPRVRAAAAEALGTARPEGSALVLRRAWSQERSTAVRGAAVVALGRIASAGDAAAREEAVPVLIAALDDDDPNVGYNAREALRTLSGEDHGDDGKAWTLWWGRAKAGG